LTIARRYTEALISLGKDDGNLEKYEKELSSFNELLKENEELTECLLNPTYHNDNKKNIIKLILDKIDFTENIKNFLFLLVDKGRILYFDEICKVYRDRLDEISGVVKAEVTATEYLTKKQKNKMQNVLSRALNKKVLIEEKIDTNIIGGIITEVEDKIYDGSIKNQIKVIKEKLIS
jgi:F-type H+-transporting ATPase subunit delta